MSFINKMNVRSKIVGITMLCFTSSAFALENGSGHSGPDTSGVSIPVELDRAVTLKELFEVNTRCMQTALVEFGIMYFHGISGIAFFPKGTSKLSYRGSDNEDYFVNYSVLMPLQIPTGAYSTCSIAFKDTYIEILTKNCSLLDELDRVDGSILALVHPPLPNSTFQPRHPSLFSRLTFAGTALQRRGTDRGNFDPERSVVTSLRISRPPVGISSALPLFGPGGYESALTLNNQAHEDCLIAGIQATSQDK